MRFPIIAIISVLFVSFVVTYTSCKKDNSKTTTKVKCVTCANGGSCINDTCRCPAGYEGAACLTQTRQRYMGSWMVFEQGSTASSPSQYSISIESSNFSSAINNVSIYYLYEYGFSTFNTVNAYVVADSIFIPTQQFNSQVIVGKGYIHPSSTFGQDGTITMRYMVTDNSTGIVTDFGYNSTADSPSVWNR